ncbi:hypothetical protein HGG72_23905 [Ochrobactrum pecoris]|nr:hypothetical protein [Brucella pecoris]
MHRRGYDAGSGAAGLSDAAQRNAKLIREKPEQVLSLITNEKSVLTGMIFRRARCIATSTRTRRLTRNAFVSVMAFTGSVVELQGERGR